MSRNRRILLQAIDLLGQTCAELPSVIAVWAYFRAYRVCSGTADLSHNDRGFELAVRNSGGRQACSRATIANASWRCFGLAVCQSPQCCMEGPDGRFLTPDLPRNLAETEALLRSGW